MRELIRWALNLMDRKFESIIPGVFGYVGLLAIWFCYLQRRIEMLARLSSDAKLLFRRVEFLLGLREGLLERVGKFLSDQTKNVSETATKWLEEVKLLRDSTVGNDGSIKKRFDGRKSSWNCLLGLCPNYKLAAEVKASLVKVNELLEERNGFIVEELVADAPEKLVILRCLEERGKSLDGQREEIERIRDELKSKADKLLDQEGSLMEYSSLTKHWLEEMQKYLQSSSTMLQGWKRGLPQGGFSCTSIPTTSSNNGDDGVSHRRPCLSCCACDEDAQLSSKMSELLDEGEDLIKEVHSFVFEGENEGRVPEFTSVTVTLREEVKSFERVRKHLGIIKGQLEWKIEDLENDGRERVRRVSDWLAETEKLFLSYDEASTEYPSIIERPCIDDTRPPSSSCSSIANACAACRDKYHLGKEVERLILRCNDLCDEGYEYLGDINNCVGPAVSELLVILRKLEANCISLERKKKNLGIIKANLEDRIEVLEDDGRERRYDVSRWFLDTQEFLRKEASTSIMERACRSTQHASSSSSSPCSSIRNACVSCRGKYELGKEVEKWILLCNDLRDKGIEYLGDIQNCVGPVSELLVVLRKLKANHISLENGKKSFENVMQYMDARVRNSIERNFQQSGRKMERSSEVTRWFEDAKSVIGSSSEASRKWQEIGKEAPKCSRKNEPLTCWTYSLSEACQACRDKYNLGKEVEGLLQKLKRLEKEADDDHFKDADNLVVQVRAADAEACRDKSKLGKDVEGLLQQSKRPEEADDDQCKDVNKLVVEVRPADVEAGPSCSYDYHLRREVEGLLQEEDHQKNETEDHHVEGPEEATQVVDKDHLRDVTVNEAVTAIGIDFGINALEKLFQHASSMIKSEESLVLSLHEHIRFLRETLPVVKDLMLNAQAVIVHEDISSASGVLLNSKVFVKGLRQLVYDLEDIVDEFDICVGSGDMNLTQKKMIAREMKKLYAEFEECKEKQQNAEKFLKFLKDNMPIFPADEVGSRSLPLLRKASMNMIERADFHMVGRDEARKSLLGDLLRSSNSKPSVVLLTGMGGIGKTTLVRDILRDPDIDRHFEFKRWATVRDRNLDPKKVLNQLIGGESAADTLYEAKKKLRSYLKRKRFLIVLDDVWDAEDLMDNWNKLWVPLSHGGEGSRVIVTTRQENVSCIMEGLSEKVKRMERLPVKVKRLGLLTDEQCLKIFECFAFPDGCDYRIPSFKEMAKQIVKEKVKGVPLAAKVIGSSLRGKGDSCWKAALLQIKGSDIDSAILWSYLNLPMQLKQCFALCSIFPKDTEFDKTELVRLWMAHSFVAQTITNSNLTLVDIGEKYLDHLVNASLIEVVEAWDNRLGKPTEDVKYKMHDLIHDFALKILGDEFSEGCKRIADPKTLRHLVIAQGQEMPENHSDIKKLYTFVSADYRHTYNFTRNQLKTVRSLRVDGVVTRMRVEELLKRLLHVRLLQFLGKGTPKFDVSESGNIDSCGNLQSLPNELPSSLEYLDIRSYHSLEFLPEKLPSSLKHLNIRSLRNLQSLPNELPSSLEYLDIRSCHSLEFLPEKLPSSLKHLNIHSLRNLQSLPNELPSSLEYLDIRSCHSLDSLPEKLPSSLKHLNIVYCRNLEFLPNELPSSLEYLGIRSCDSLEYLPNELPSSLEYLDIRSCYSLEYLPNELPSSLEYLDIRSCYSFKSLPEKLPSSLKHLNIDSCINLRSLPNELPSSLEYLDIRSCYGFKSLPNELPSSLEYLHIRFCNSLDSLPEKLPSSLKHLNIDSCINLRSLPNELPSSLEYLDIRSCYGFKSLPEKLPSSLKHLNIDSCRNLKYLPNELPSSVEYLHIQSCHGLESLPEKLPSSLKHLNIDSCINLRSLPNELPSSLEYLDIRSCYGFKSLPEKLPSSLKHLNIDSCRNLEYLPNELPSSVEYLHIQSCHGLESLPEKLPSSVKYLLIQSCHGLESLPEKLPSSVKHLKIDSWKVS